MRVIECEQNTESWHKARCGRCTGSRIADVMAKSKSKDKNGNLLPSAMRATYMGELIAERLSGFQPMDGYKSPAMKWGSDNEDAACSLYAFMYDAEPIKVGFVLHPELDWAGASPDRLVGDKGCLQVKCPNSSTHADSLLGAPVDSKYMKQMQFEMLCAEREFCDFVSYDPRYPAEMQLWVKRVMRDEAMIKEIEREVRLFLEELDERLASLRKLYPGVQEAA